MDSTQISITGHCYKRYLERTGAIDKYRLKVMKIIEQGKEVKSNNSLMKLLRNGCKDARYFELGGLIAVVDVGTNNVLTVMQRAKGKWRDI